MNMATPTLDIATATLVPMAKAMPLASIGAAPRLTHLQQLEAESIHIIRETAAESDNPVLLYSIGKDSSVLLHLALKAFYPAKLPFPLLHVDTTWKFRDMIAFRDRRTKELGLNLIVHVNQDGIKRGIGPISHPERHTDVMKTHALRQALDRYQFDAALGGARRDEERSRAKERVFSLRSAQHRWDPKRQRAEPWRLYNARKRRGESLRVFPLSNWTEARFAGSGLRRVLDGRCGFRSMVASWTGTTGVLRSTQMGTIRIALSRSCRADLPAFSRKAECSQ